MALRTVIIYPRGDVEPVYTYETSPAHDRAIKSGASRYGSPRGTTLRYAMPGASHSDAWRHTLAESVIASAIARVDPADYPGYDFTDPADLAVVLADLEH